MNHEATFLIYIIKYLLSDAKTEFEECDFTIDWDKLFALAKRHGILHLIYEILPLMPEDKRPDATKEMTLYQSSMQAIVVNENQLQAAEELFSSFEEKGIDVVAVKGVCTKMHYPTPYYRTMGDIDLLFKSEQQGELASVFAELKYDQSEEGRKHDSYFRQPYINVEMHRELLAVDSQYYEYYNNIWERVSLKDGKNHIYEMTLEDEYLFMLLHLLEHFMNGGIGIRFIMDVCIYRRLSNIDWVYVENELRKLNLLEFHNNIISLETLWFEEETQLEKEIVIREMESYIIANGVFGSMSNAADITAEKQGKFKFFVRTVFPNYKNMCSIYPWLKGWPILLPYSWFLRGVRSILFRRKNIKIQLKKVKTGNREQGKKLMQFYQKCGL